MIRTSYMVRGTKQRDQSCVFDNVDQGNVNMKKFIEKIDRHAPAYRYGGSNIFL